MLQRWGITRFEKCKYSEMVTVNVKVEGSYRKYIGLSRAFK
jgi:hypothetical protein